jgi:hypothetical protein
MTARLPRSGAAPMTGALKLAEGTVGSPALTFNGATNIGIYKTTTGFGLAVSGVLVAEFNSSGFVLSKTALFKDGGDTASASALTLGDGNVFNITGTIAITSIATKGVGAVVMLRFAEILTLTHDATNLILSTGANITTAAGDWAVFEEHVAGKWRMVSYHRATGDPLRIAGPIASAFKNLSIKVASNTTVTVTADAVTTTNGTNFQTTAVNSTIDLGTTGADALDTGGIAAATWYAIWVVAKAYGTTKCVASTSGSSPTMPADYTYKARIGWVRTATAAAQLLGTWQLGRQAQYILGLAQTSLIPLIVGGAAGDPSVPTWTAVSVSSFVPSTASMIRLHLYSNSSAASKTTQVAPNSSYGNNTAANNAPPLGLSHNLSGNVFYQKISGEMMLESTNIYYASSATDTGLLCQGWEDNI